MRKPQPPPEKLPPHNDDVEKAMLGCLIENGDLSAEINPEWFYCVKNRALAECIIQMNAFRVPIDLVTVSQAFKATGVPNTFELIAECMKLFVSVTDFPYFRNVLKSCYSLRQVIKTAQEHIDLAMSSTTTDVKAADELLSSFESKSFQIRKDTDGSDDGEVDNSKAAMNLISRYEDAFNNKKPSGLMTGFSDTDRILSGLKPSQFFVIAARPGIGKTSLALALVEKIAIDQQIHSGVFSFEMSGEELFHRLATSIARVNGHGLNNGSATQEEIVAVSMAMPNAIKNTIHICDKAGLTIAQVCSRARRMVYQHGVKLLVMDHIGLIHSGIKGHKKYEEATYVSNVLKELARELKIPIIGLCQLSREVEKEKRLPRMSDLRDSGAIEQDADIIAFLHKQTDDENQHHQSTENIDLIFAKNRSGPIGTAPLVFFKEYTRYEQREQNYDQP